MSFILAPLDSVSHQRLLDCTGIRTSFEFLHDQEQRVLVEGQHLEWMMVTSRVLHAGVHSWIPTLPYITINSFNAGLSSITGYNYGSLILTNPNAKP